MLHVTPAEFAWLPIPCAGIKHSGSPAAPGSPSPSGPTPCGTLSSQPRGTRGAVAGCPGSRLPGRSPHHHEIRPGPDLAGRARHLHRRRLRRRSPVRHRASWRASTSAPPGTPIVTLEPPTNRRYARHILVVLGRRSSTPNWQVCRCAMPMRCRGLLQKCCDLPPVPWRGIEVLLLRGTACPT
jgi:hypothetical protein